MAKTLEEIKGVAEEVSKSSMANIYHTGGAGKKI